MVTGASGFVGRHVAPVLRREGSSVRRAAPRADGHGRQGRD
ncbi:NAD-dependent epimerase/dehydratase family protein [Bradyrhizobium sp. CCBAU 45384]|nr:NAD-dependent epimerase/dehydratase family protein [Bradyrhizobium sp. CCBAU 45384]